MSGRMTPKRKELLYQIADLIARSRCWHTRRSPVSTKALQIYLNDIQTEKIKPHVLLLYVLLFFDSSDLMTLPQKILRQMAHHGWIHRGRTTYWGVVEAMRSADTSHFPKEFADAFVAAEDRFLSSPRSIGYNGLEELKPYWADRIGRLAG